MRVQREFDIRECSVCKHRFAELQPGADHVAAVYGDDYFFGGGAGYPDYLEEGELLRAHARRYARLIRKYVQPGAMLDVGAASGFLCDGFRAAGWQPEGLEPNERMAAYGRDQLRLPFHNATLETFSGTRQYDLISMIQVLAHFTSPRCSMRNAAALTPLSRRSCTVATLPSRLAILLPSVRRNSPWHQKRENSFPVAASDWAISSS